MSAPVPAPPPAEVERWLEALYVAAEGATLRAEDRRKAVEVAALLAEIAAVLRRAARRRPFVLVDAAAGKSYVGLLAAKLLLEPDGRASSVVTLEREPARVAASRAALARLDTGVPAECRRGDVSEASAWPDEASLVVALHACGPAADAVIERTIASRAAALLLVPCCTSAAVPAAATAEAGAAAAGIPRHAPVKRRFIQAMVDAERTWRLEAAGYETEVVEFVGALVTPHNLLWRARRVGEPVRMARAQESLAQWRERVGSGPASEHSGRPHGLAADGEPGCREAAPQEPDGGRPRAQPD
jgi:hypothetical protein